MTHTGVINFLLIFLPQKVVPYRFAVNSADFSFLLQKDGKHKTNIHEVAVNNNKKKN